LLKSERRGLAHLALAWQPSLSVAAFGHAD